MNGFIPHEQFHELKHLGYNQESTYEQAFSWFKEKYNLLQSIGITNISVYQIPTNNYHTTYMIQDCQSYEEAALATLKEFINYTKNN